MRPGSIRFQLWSAAAISLVLALAVAGLGLSYLFERHVERRVESELTLELYQLIGTTTLEGNQFRTSPAPTDPRFAVPLSGYYWQVEESEHRCADAIAFPVGRNPRPAAGRDERRIASYAKDCGAGEQQPDRRRTRDHRCQRPLVPRRRGRGSPDRCGFGSRVCHGADPGGRSPRNRADRRQLRSESRSG